MSIGYKIWVIPGGHIPPNSSGPEPSCTSRDELCLLNTNDSPVQVRMTIYYEDREPVGPYKIELAKTSVRHIRFNDLVDPLPIPLDTDYAAVIKSDLPIVVQFTRVDTGNGNYSTFSTMGFPG